VGCYSANSELSIGYRNIELMSDTIAHRGPDGYGVWLSPENNCILSHRRLAIVDLSTAALQPMSNFDQSITVVFNGEIYNHRDLRQQLISKGYTQWKTDHSDTEVILHGYQQWGIEVLQKLIGMFSIAIYDRRNIREPVLHLARDRVGIKPLYVNRTQRGEWVFGSEIKALLKHPDVFTTMSTMALSHYLTFIVAPAPYTMFKDIWKIPAGHRVEISGEGDARSFMWWDCKPSKILTFSEHELPFDDAKVQLESRLQQSIERRMVSDVPFGVLLSGGVDSSLNVALMSRLMNRPVTTFSVGYQGQESNNEFQYARQVADLYHTNHHEILIDEKDLLQSIPDIIYHQDEPIADNVCIPLYHLARLVKQKDTKVVQVGEGADENFLGYWWCQNFIQMNDCFKKNHRSKTYIKKYLTSLVRKILNRPPCPDEKFLQRYRSGQELFWGGAECWTGLMRDELIPDSGILNEQIKCPIQGLLPDVLMDTDSHAIISYYTSQLGLLDGSELFQKIPYIEMKNRLPEHLLMRVDKMTMAHSIEARVPFLDHDVVEFAMRLPLSYKINDNIGKFIIKKIAESYLPKHLIYRKKQGFGAPMEAWFKNDKFIKLCHHAIMTSKLVNEGLFSREYLLKLLKHQSAFGGGYSFHLWTVMNVILWQQFWVDKNLDWTI